MIYLRKQTKSMLHANKYTTKWLFVVFWKDLWDEKWFEDAIFIYSTLL